MQEIVSQYLPVDAPFINFGNPDLHISPDDIYFLDTSLLIAIADPADIFHNKASTFWARIEQNILVSHSAAMVEFAHVYCRTLYVQERKNEIFYQAGGDWEKSKEAIDKSNFSSDWDWLCKNRPYKTQEYFKQVLPCILPLLQNNIITLHPDNLDIVMDSFDFKMKYHLGSVDAILIAVAKSIGAIFVTTDLRLANIHIPGIIKYATTP